MENCDICCEKINKINHKKVECPFCDLKACRSCCQKYILSIFDDPHCMGCKNPWNREFIDSFCSQSFRNNELRIHRENILFEREKTLMPGTQLAAEKIIKFRRFSSTLKLQKERLVDLYERYNLPPPLVENANITLPTEIVLLYREIEITYQNIWNILNIDDNDSTSKKFIRQCPMGTCHGFLDEEWFCSLCSTHFCKECNERLENDHKCDHDVVKTMKLLNQDSKSCPKCGTVIHKMNGCDQMWCVNCHTTFNWDTLEIEKGRIHNPHFIEFRSKNILSREHGDIPCGGIPTLDELLNAGADEDILQYLVIIIGLQSELFFMDTEPHNTRQFRIAYMINDIDEATFKKILQRIEKFAEKTKDVMNIYELLIHTCGDLLRQYIVEPWRRDDITSDLKNIVGYGNTIFESIRKRYKSMVPKNVVVL